MYCFTWNIIFLSFHYINILTFTLYNCFMWNTVYYTICIIIIFFSFFNWYFYININLSNWLHYWYKFINWTLEQLFKCCYIIVINISIYFYRIAYNWYKIINWTFEQLFKWLYTIDINVSIYFYRIDWYYFINIFLSNRIDIFLSISFYRMNWKWESFSFCGWVSNG